MRKLSDGGGLQLWVYPTGGRVWRFAYRFDEKQKALSFGPYPVITLADARKARDDAKRLLIAGSDPGDKAKEAEVADTFRQIAQEYVAKLQAEGRSEATLNKVSWLLSFAYPTLGDRPIKGIDPPMVLAALRPLEARGRYESARRLRSTVGSVFRYAMATARASTDPTSPFAARLSGLSSNPAPPSPTLKNWARSCALLMASTDNRRLTPP